MAAWADGVRNGGDLGWAAVYERNRGSLFFSLFPSSRNPPRSLPSASFLVLFLSFFFVASKPLCFFFFSFSPVFSFPSRLLSCFFFQNPSIPKNISSLPFALFFLVLCFFFQHQTKLPSFSSFCLRFLFFLLLLLSPPPLPLFSIFLLAFSFPLFQSGSSQFFAETLLNLSQKISLAAPKNLQPPLPFFFLFVFLFLQILGLQVSNI